jgi:hypothetical protein
MSLSTSSFKREGKVLLVCGLLLLLAEVGTRVLLRSLSRDVQHLTELSRLVENMRGTSSPRLVFLGNSTTRAAVNLHVIEQYLNEHHAKDVALLKINPDDSTLPDWYYLMRDLLNRKQFAPDVVVVSGLLQHLDDYALVHSDRIADSYGGLKNTSEIFQHEIRGMEERLTYIASSISQFYANRERFRHRILDLIIPNYNDSANRINRQLRAKEGKALTRSYSRLIRFLDLCKSNGILPVIVALPVALPYPVDPAIKRTVEHSGGVFLDLTRVQGLSSAHFPDLLHMNEQGSKLFSSALASSLVSLARIEAKLSR